MIPKGRRVETKEKHQERPAFDNPRSIMPKLLLWTLGAAVAFYAALFSLHALVETVREDNERIREATVVEHAKQVVGKNLKDEESARYYDVVWHRINGRELVCGWVNSRNGFGAYAGRSPWMVDVEKETVWIGSDTSSDDDAAIWKKLCAR